MKRAMRERSHIIEDEHTLDTIDTSEDAEVFYTNDATVDDDTVDTFDIDEYDTDESTAFPTVRLHYPSDYDTVKNLPSKRLKRSSKKKVRSWPNSSGGRDRNNASWYISRWSVPGNRSLLATR